MFSGGPIQGLGSICFFFDFSIWAYFGFVFLICFFCFLICSLISALWEEFPLLILESKRFKGMPQVYPREPVGPKVLFMASQPPPGILGGSSQLVSG